MAEPSPDGAPLAPPAGRIAVGADERLQLVDHVLGRLRERGFTVEVEAPEKGRTAPWPLVAETVALKVRAGACDLGILFCWTGTGVAMAANKVPGVRAALCADAQTAAGARKWNDANVLVMSLRATTPAVADEILEAWFSTGPEAGETERFRQLEAIDRRHRGPA